MTVIKRKERKEEHNLLLGCGSIVVLALLALSGLVGFTFNQERRAGQYPGSVRMSTHSNYKSLPQEFRWDDSYRTADPMPDVYNWYSGGFDLGPESRANGSCILLEGLKAQFVIERYTGVMICDTPTGRMVFMSRSMGLR